MTNTQKLIKHLNRGWWIDPNRYYKLTGSHTLSQMIGFIRRKHGIVCKTEKVVKNGGYYYRYRIEKV